MTIAVGVASLRLRQMSAIARPATRVVTWKPLASTMLVGLAMLTFGNRADVVIFLSITGAAMAAASAFMLDDPAAVTLASSPTSLPVRQLLRVCAVVLGAGVAWFVAASVSVQRVGGLPLRGLTLEFAVLVVVALAASAVAARMGDRTGGGIAGAIVTMGCFATTFLPSRSWMPFPAEPSAPGAAARLVGVLAVATAVLLAASSDPARHRLVRRARSAHW